MGGSKVDGWEGRNSGQQKRKHAGWVATDAIQASALLATAIVASPMGAVLGAAPVGAT